MSSRRPRSRIIHGHPVAPGERQWSAVRQLAELSKASLAFRNAVAQLGDVTDLQGFLETMLLEALRAAGTGSGAVVLVEGEPGQECAHHIVILERGQPLSRDTKQARGLERVPFDAALRDFASRVATDDDGCRSTPDDALYPPAFRAYLQEQGVVETYTTALRVGGRMIGWFGVGYFEPTRMGADQLALHRLMADQMAVTMEVTRLAERARLADRADASRTRIEQIARANRALVGAADQLSGTADIDAVLAYVLQTINAQFPGSRSSALWLIDTQRQLQYRHMSYIDGQLSFGPGTSDPGGLPRPIYPQLMRPRMDPVQPFFLRHADLPEDRRVYAAKWGAHDAVVFPMYLREEPLGVFAVGLPPDHPDPPAEDLQIAQTLANQGMLALRLKRMGDESRAAAVAEERSLAAQHRVGELVKANRALTASLDATAEGHDIDRTLARLLQVVADQIDCRGAALCLRNDGSDVFRAELTYRDGIVSTPEAGSEPLHACPARGNRLWRALIADRKPVLIDRPADTDDGPMLDWFMGAGARTLLGVPLVQRRRVIGCFTFVFSEPRRFAVEQIELLQTLAHQATLAVQLERSASIARDESRQAATLAERARIARDLHDTLAQGLTGILMQLQASLRASDPAQARLRVEAALDNARGALVDARRSVHALRSIADERIDFTAAVNGVLKTAFAGSAVTTRVDIDGDLPNFAEATENELLRIVQEACTNCLKHARASRFTVGMRSLAAGFELLLEDDGVGFAAPQAAEGFGLVGIGERAADLGAELAIEGSRGTGTRIRLLLPRRRTTNAISPSP